MLRREIFFFVAFPHMTVLSHLGRICRYLQSLGPKYSSSANINSCSHVERECVVDLSLVECLWWGIIIKFIAQRGAFIYFLKCSAEVKWFAWWQQTCGGKRPCRGTSRERQLSLSGSLTVFHWAEKLASVLFAFSASTGCQELLPCWVGLSDEWKPKEHRRVVNYCR